MFRSRVRPNKPDWVVPTWAGLVRNYLAQVYRSAYRFTGNRYDAEDLIQGVFVRVFKSIHNFQPGTLEGWLHRTTTDLFLDSARHRRRIHMNALNSAPEHVWGQDRSPEKFHADGALDADVANALTALKPGQCVAIVLRDIEGMSYEEISEVLDIKFGTARSQIIQGRTRLRDTLTHRALSEDHVRYPGVLQEVRGNGCHHYGGDLPGSADQTLPERHVNQVSEHLVWRPECSVTVDELWRVHSRLNSCQVAATLLKTLAERL